MNTKEFGRIAAQTARNIIRQGIRDGERGQMIIPKEARKIFDIKAGDTLIVLGDEKWGLAVTKADVLEKHAMNVFQKISEEQTDENK